MQSREMYMLPPIDRAKLSATALASSIKINESTAHELLAQALGYETWAHYISRATLAKPDQLDQTMNPDIAQHRLAEFTSQLMIVLGSDSLAIESLAKAISPYSLHLPKPHRVDMNDDDAKEGDIDLLDMFESVGGDDAMLQFVHELAEQNPELSRLKNFDTFKDLQNAFRVSAPLEPSLYYNALANLTDWQLDDTFFEPEYEYLEPSFHLVSPFDEVEYPVFLTSMMSMPGDSSDGLFEKMKRDISKYSGRALILFKDCSFKEIEGLIYAVVGAFYNGNGWNWTLLTSDDPDTQSRKILPDNFDLESPVLGLQFRMTETQEIPNHILYHAIVNDLVEPDSGTVELSEEQMTVKSVGGWSQMLF